RAPDHRVRARARGESRRAFPLRLPRRGRRIRSAYGDPPGRRAGVRAMDMIDTWLAEDVGSGDPTSPPLVDADATREARVPLNGPGVVSGRDGAAAVFERLGARLEPLVAEGAAREPTEVARVDGPARAVLTGERTALNLLGRLSGIATLTRSYVDAVAGTGAV